MRNLARTMSSKETGRSSSCAGVFLSVGLIAAFAFVGLELKLRVAVRGRARCAGTKATEVMCFVKRAIAVTGVHASFILIVAVVK